MALESCMILLDNSEYMRNGDYIPTRLEAQRDAANLLVSTKTQSNPETTVGVSAGTELLVSPTDQVGLLLGALRNVQYKSTGNIDVAASVQVASLALKHRRNKNGAQRIVLFVGSPLNVDSKILTRAGRQLKKNNVSIDVVAMGEFDENEAKLRELVDAANGQRGEEAERTCHLISIPTGVLPSDVLASSPLLGGGGFAASAGVAAAAAGAANAAGGGEAGGGFADYGGVDPNMDPELAMALRVSMEEERVRQERAAAAAAASQEETTVDATMEETDPTPPDATVAAVAAAPAMDLGLSEEEALLQQALAMSMNENEPTAGKEEEQVEDTTKLAAAATAPSTNMDMDGEEDEEAAMQMALQMSMQPEDAASNKKEEARADPQPQFQDPAFVNQLLGSLPGVNPNDPAIQSALKDAAAEEHKKDASSKKDEDDDDKKKE